jgi:hypothetical protein
MIGLMMTTLVFLVSITVGVGLAGAHDGAPKPSVMGETMDSLSDSGAGTQGDGDGAELEGTLEIVHEDREDGTARYHHLLSTDDGQRLSLEGVRHPDLLTGDRVRVRGVRAGQKLHLQMGSAGNALQTNGAETLQVLQYAPPNGTFGPQSVVVLMVNFSNDPSRPGTVSDMQYWMTFADDFYRANSYGQTSLSVDVFGWYTLPMTNAGCPTQTIKTKADQAAAAGVNLSAYARRVYYFPYLASCGFGGMATIGGNPSSAWINGYYGMGAIHHELGHNFGLYHSHSMSRAPAILGPNCTTSEYGDVTDTMGANGGPFNAFQKERLGWLGYGASPPITKVTASGTYSLSDNGSPGITPKALKIQRGTTTQASMWSYTPLPLTGFQRASTFTWGWTARPIAATSST